MKKSKQWENPTVHGGSAFQRAWTRSQRKQTRTGETRTQASYWFKEGYNELLRLQSINKVRRDAAASNPPPETL